MASSVVKRNISFWRLKCEKNGNDVDVLDIFKYINDLPFDENGRYLGISGDRSLVMFVDSLKKPIKLRMGTIRKSDLPLIEKNGLTNPLSLDEGEGLMEPVHLMIFDKNIIGFEFNWYGPRIGVLPNYLLQRTIDLIDNAEIYPLIRKDVLKMLSKVGELKVFSIKFQRDMAEHFKELNNSLKDFFNVIKKTTDAPTIDITLKHEPYSRNGINVSFLNNKNLVAKWLKNPEVKDNVHKFWIKCKDKETHKTIEFDLIKEYLVSKKFIQTKDDKHKAVDTDSAYGAIIDSYLELKEDINELIVEE